MRLPCVSPASPLRLPCVSFAGTWASVPHSRRPCIVCVSHTFSTFPSPIHPSSPTFPTTGVIADRKKFFHEAVVDETATPDDALDKFQIFEKWLLDNGAAFPQLYVRRPEGERRRERRRGGDGGLGVCGRTYEACSLCSFERAGHPIMCLVFSSTNKCLIPTSPPLPVPRIPPHLSCVSRISPRISPRTSPASPV